MRTLTLTQQDQQLRGTGRSSSRDAASRNPLGAVASWEQVLATRAGSWGPTATHMWQGLAVEQAGHAGGADTAMPRSSVSSVENRKQK